MGRVVWLSVVLEAEKNNDHTGRMQKKTSECGEEEEEETGAALIGREAKARKTETSEGRKKIMREKREKSDHLLPETEKGSEHDRANKGSSKKGRKYSLAKRRGTSLISLNSFTKNNVGEIKQIWPFRCYFIKDKSENIQLLGYFSSTVEFSDSTYTNLPLQTSKTTVSRTCHRY